MAVKQVTKPKPATPASWKQPHLHLRMPPELFSRLHTQAQKERRPNTNMALILIEDALRAREGK